MHVCECVWVCVCVRTCRRTGAEGSRGLEAQFCSVNLWHRARGVYHSASEFVVPRLVTSRSVFRTQALPYAFISFSPLFAAIYLHNIRGGHAENVHALLCIQGRVPETSRNQMRSSRYFHSIKEFRWILMGWRYQYLFLNLPLLKIKEE